MAHRAGFQGGMVLEKDCPLEAERLGDQFDQPLPDQRRLRRAVPFPFQ